MNINSPRHASSLTNGCQSLLYYSVLLPAALLVCLNIVIQFQCPSSIISIPGTANAFVPKNPVSIGPLRSHSHTSLSLSPIGTKHDKPQQPSFRLPQEKRASSRAQAATSLNMNWFSSLSSNTGEKTQSPLDDSNSNIQNRKQGDKIVISDKIGSGSYGTVHYCKFEDNDTSANKSTFYVAKRAWTVEELTERNSKQQKSSSPSSLSTTPNSEKAKKEEKKKMKERTKRCQFYLDVEQHCLEKINSDNIKYKGKDDNSSINKDHLLPNFIGRFKDHEDGNEWLVFDLIASTHRTNDEQDGTKNNNTDDIDSTPKAAKSLNDAIFLDWKDQHKTGDVPHHHLYMIQKELGMEDETSNADSGTTSSTTFEDTLDVMMKSLLEVLVEIHKHNIVHRDIKPDNLLVDGNKQSLVLIDFGSAADMDPTKGGIGGFGKRIGLDDSIVAISPIYSAPETFVRLGEDALKFDVFSAGLIFCQLLFNLLDERTDAAFRQQLDQANFDLDVWLERELQSTIRPAGFDDGMLYLADRPGLWRLLKGMLDENPFKRISSKKALKQYKEVMTNLESETIVSREDIDGPYFDSVITTLELCSVPDDDEEMDYEVPINPPNLDKSKFVIPRPLHYIATFERGTSLGLILSEAETDEEDEDDENLKKTRQAWEIATQNAGEGEVFVRGIVEDGQAESMGIIEIGDRLVGVGEFPFFNSGFGGFLQMLDRVPTQAKNIKIHFDRQSKVLQSKLVTSSRTSNTSISSQGAWSTKGKRNQNEDTFILQEIHDDEMHSVLIAGIFDGHGGDAASKTACQILPSLLSTELKSENLPNALKSAWDTTCETYQDGCSIYGECVADYDPREGVLVAGTGAKDLIAGTTAAVAALSIDPATDELIVLNCGDSRTLIIGEPKDKSMKECVHFVTKDHSPRCKSEADRLRAGKEKGLDYSEPQCSVNRWWLKVGDYNYAVSRSLEGQFATSKGITSEADISTVSLTTLMEQRKNAMMIIASDGLFEVLDNEFVGREAVKMRKDGKTAKNTAKKLCSLALEKNTSDNVSAVVVFFE